MTTDRYNPADAARIQQLLDALSASDDADERARIKRQLSDLIFGTPKPEKPYGVFTIESSRGL